MKDREWNWDDIDRVGRTAHSEKYYKELKASVKPLPREKAAAVAAIAEKYITKIGAGNVDRVLAACSLAMEAGKKPKGRPPKAEKDRRGRRGDDRARSLVYYLACCWEKAGGILPEREQSQFGSFVGGIAKALGFKGALTGYVRDFLKKRADEAVRFV